MRFSVRLPTDRVHCGEEFASAEGIAEIAASAERAGFDGCFVTDHPFPVQRWLDGGGHHALDPFVALAFAAAATTRIRLQTHILVLPYRNPFLAAKSALSLDVLSKGRLILGVATGYLRGEFSALGADFEARNEVAEESIRAMKRAWTEDDVVFEGRGFHARGNTMLPRPAQQPHPPVWVGGNSRQAIRRAVELGEGWVPFPNTRAMAPHTRTATIETRADLAERIGYAREHANAIGRSAPLDICFSLGGEGDEEVPGRDALGAEVESLAALGVTWLAVGFPGETRAEYLDAVAAFGARLSRLR
jgi:probable F420-dependent oxidoreductase